MVRKLNRDKAETIACPTCGADGLITAIGKGAHLDCPACGADHHYRQFMRPGWAMTATPGDYSPVLIMPTSEEEII